MDDIFFQTFLDKLFAFLLAFAAAAIAAVLTFILIYLVIIYFRLKKREKVSLEMTTVEIKVPKDNEIKIDAAEQMFASFSSLKKSGFMSFLDVEDVIAFEIVGKNSDIRFYVSAPSKIIDLVEKTVYGYYPSADIRRVEEPNIFSEEGKVDYCALVQKTYPYYPVKTYKELPTDSISAIASSLSKMDEGEGAIVQILIRPASSSWKKAG